MHKLWCGIAGKNLNQILFCLNVILALYNIIWFRSLFPISFDECTLVLRSNVPISSSIAPSAFTPSPQANSLVLATDVDFPLSNNDRLWQIESHDKFWIVGNYAVGNGTAPLFDESITLTTQGTHEFFSNVEPLCQRWGGPISMAVYAPGTDVNIVRDKISYMMQCHKCTSENVTFHLVYDKKFSPGSPDETLPRVYIRDPDDCSVSVDSLFNGTTFKRHNKLPYPINVLRNAARVRAKTKYVLASDVELYPSDNVIPRLIKLLKKEEAENPYSRRVYTFPIFEVTSDTETPHNKSQLQQLFKAQKAVFFHKYVCDQCQRFPDRDKWLDQIPDPDSMGVFRTTKRRRALSSWEPIYVGTNEEPFYQEKLSWEGKKDKMSQMYELCLLNYDFRILDNAFLCHAPGIKHYVAKKESYRNVYMHENALIEKKFVAQLRQKYSANAETINSC